MDPNTIMWALRPDAVALDPFAHVVQPDALPGADYAELAAAFPPLSVIADGAAPTASNVAVRMNARAALSFGRLSAAWRRFFAYHTSAEYWLQVVRVFGAPLRAAFPALEDRIGRRLEDWRVGLRGTDADADIRLDCQFVMNTPVVQPSSVKTPHVDKHDKIFSALFYMRADDDQAAGGDLDLYRWRRAPRFVRHRVLPTDVEHAKTVRYAPNTYVAFVNSPASVHGVSPRAATSVPRRYVNFIAEVPVRAFATPQIRGPRRWWHGWRAADEY
jgi:hypothetical protein